MIQQPLIKVFFSFLVFHLLCNLNLQAFQSQESIHPNVLPAHLKEKKIAAEQLNNEGEWDAAIQLYQSIQKECLGLHLESLAIDFYEDIFTIIVLRDDYDFEKKIDFIQKIKSSENHPYFEGIYYATLAHAYMFEGIVDSMPQWYELAIKSYTKDKRYKLATNLNVTIASEFYFLEDLKKAKEYLQKAEHLEKTKLSPQTIIVPNLYPIQGAIYTELGEYEKARISNLMSLSLLEKDSSTYYLDLAYGYNNLASTYSSLKDFNKALNYYKKALALIENAPEYSSIEAASFTYNIGAIYQKQGNQNLAKIAFLKSLSDLEKGGEMNTEMQFDFINNCQHLVDCYQFENQLDSALHYAQAAEKLNQTFPYRIATTYSCFSGIYLEQNNLSLAQKYAQKSLQEALDAYGNKNEFVFCAYEQLAKISAAENQYQKAIYYCQKGLETISINFEDEQGLTNPNLDDILFKGELLRVLHLKMFYLEKLYRRNDPTVSNENLYAVAKLATLALERMNKSMKSEASKLFWLNKKAIPLFEEAIAIALDIYKKTKDKNYLNEAFMLSERSKSMLMMEALQETNASSYGGIPDSLVQQEKALDKLLLEAEKLRFNAKIEEDIETYRLQDSLIFHYKHDLDVLAHTFETNFARYYKLKYETKVASITELQATLEDKTTLIEYFEGKDHIYAFVISTKEAFVKVIDLEDSYTHNIVNFQKTLVDIQAVANEPANAFNSFAQTAHHFYNYLIKDCLTPNTERLIIIPDGHLGYIPFEVLLTHKITIINQKDKLVNFGDLPYLLRDYKINYNYSATLLLTQLNQKSSIINGNILGFAPSYADITSPYWRGQHEQQLRKDLTTLPGAQREVNLLSWSFGGHFLKGLVANEAQFKEEAPHYGILHLAMHGLVDKLRPEFSGLAMEEDHSQTEDNILYAYEIKQLELNAGLVVLSACETGIGKYQRGEGVLSIGRGFMYAGVPSLVMTLWNLNDFSSAVIMEQFYSNLSQGMEKDEAIRQAKLSYLSEYDGLPTHPALWACFVQVGDYRSIPLKRAYWMYFYIIGGLLLIIGLGFAYKKYNA